MLRILIFTLAMSGAALPVKFLVPAGSAKPAQAGKFLSTNGRRAALLGREDGTFEAWTYPLKVVRDFRLAAYIDGAMEPTPLAELAERVQASPGRVTITHAHAAFTLRQTWIAAIDKDVAVILLDIDTSRPLRLRASFVPEMKPMWPASFGGQSTGWVAEEGMLVLGEGLRRFRTVVGSPLFSRITEQVGHQMPDRTVMLEMEITPEQARRNLIPIVIAGSRELYRESLGRIEALVRESDAYYRRFDERTLSVQTPEPLVNRAYDAARVALDKGWACNEGVGCGLIAGWGPSGLSERPGFGWYFGGDAFMNSWAILDYGDFERVRDLLVFLRDRQREDGKMMHELTQSAALLDWSKYLYGYYHADTTPLYLFSAARYVRRSGDRKFMEESWASFEKAYRLCLTALDSDGLLSNRKLGAAAVETGALSGKVEKDIYLQGVWLGGLQGFIDLAGWMGKKELAGDAQARLSKARSAVEAWYSESKRLLPFGRLTDGSNYDALSGWQAFALAWGGLKKAVAEPATESLNRATLSTDWGTRLFATDSPYYDALGYNDGSVWPFVTGFVIQAEYAHKRPWAGFQHLYGLAQASGLAGEGFMTENMSGDRYQALPRSVPHQLFSSSPIVHCMVSGLLGLDGNAMEGRMTITPQLPPQWSEVRIRGFRVGQSVVEGTIRRQGRSISADLRATGAPLLIRRETIYASPAVEPVPPQVRFEPGDRSRGYRPVRLEATATKITYEVDTLDGAAVEFACDRDWKLEGSLEHEGACPGRVRVKPVAAHGTLRVTFQRSVE